MPKRAKKVSVEERQKIEALLRQGKSVPGVRRETGRSESLIYGIRNQLEKAPPSSRQMEQSGHWPGLRQAARTLQRQLDAPLPEQLGFPWMYPGNSALRLTFNREEVTVRLAVEDDVIFQVLKVHLPEDSAWDLLTDWEKAVGDMAKRLVRLVDLVKEQPETSDKPWVAGVEGNSIELGLTDWFAKTVALKAAETVCDADFSSYEWEYLEPLPERRPWVLRRVRDGSSYIDVAFASSREGLEELAALHGELQRRAEDFIETKAIATESQRVTDVTKALTKELDRVSNLALFPGRCRLCGG